MSCAARCLRSTVSEGSAYQLFRIPTRPKFVAGTRRYAHAQAMLKRQEVEHPRRQSRFEQSESSGRSLHIESEPEVNTQTSSTPSSSSAGVSDAWVDETGWSPDPTQRRPTEKRREEYFSRLFDNLRFPPQLAQKVLTHSSHSAARRGHNGSLAFLGRRVIAAYFMMFLHSTGKLRPGDDIEDISARSLNTYLLGEYVGNDWGVGRELIWAPNTSSTSEAGAPLPGLYKVQGETVQAMLGLVFHQYGGSVAHRVFHSRLLPLVLVRGGLPQHFHEDVKRIAKQMGGSNGPLLVPGEMDSKKKLATA